LQAIQLRDSGLWCWSLRDKGGEYFRVCVENGKMLSLRSWRIVLPGVVLLAICAAYANHFQNSFHFDDAHTVVDNPYIRTLRNVPRFFMDATTFSVLPSNRTYRPFVSVSLAIDYAVGHGYNPLWFHLSTFLIFLLQLGAMYALYAGILRAVRPEPEAQGSNQLIALLSVAWYGLNPAMAETVNYIIQRGDIFCAAGVVAALAAYAWLPQLRKTGLYLLPFAFALLSKPPAAVFPLLLFLYFAMFEGEGKDRYAKAALASLPSIALCVVLMWLQSAMTPKTFAPSAISTYSYCITQPFVLMRYFGALFVPVHLNVDTDLRPFATLNGIALSGFLFVALLLAAAWFTARRQKTRPVSFGLLWFFITSLPTSLYRLSEVENDHRMYLPFVGLLFATAWSAYLIVEYFAGVRRRAVVRRAALICAILVLALCAWGTHIRNRIWHTEESLWLDDVTKSPRNGRGWMNYGLTQMEKGAYAAALDCFQRAAAYAPNYKTLEINLGIVHGALGHTAEAEQHYQRAIELGPRDDEAHFYFGQWLYQYGRVVEATWQFETAANLNPSRLPTRDMLARAYVALGEPAGARAIATETLRLEPADETAQDIVLHPAPRTADEWISASLYQYQGGNYEKSIASATRALQSNPHSAIAYNNIGSAYAALKVWDLAIENERMALRLQPDFTLAKNNLALCMDEKAGKVAQPEYRTADDWLNASLHDHQVGQYLESIKDAEHALRLRPDYAEAYNNIAASYESMGRWDEAIEAARKAVRLKPDFELAKNNLEWAEDQKRLRHP
jgi:tetratricopeptide (TPR) repeat protein